MFDPAKKLIEQQNNDLNNPSPVEASTQPTGMIINSAKLKNKVAREFVGMYLKENGGDYKDAIEQLLTLDEQIESGTITDETLQENSITLPDPV